MLGYGMVEPMNRNSDLLGMSQFHDQEFDQALQMLNQISDKGLRASLKASSLWLRVATTCRNERARRSDSRLSSVCRSIDHF